MGRKGFSLIEMMFVFVLVGVIMAIGFPRLKNSLEKQNIRNTKALMSTLVATARGTAVQRGCNATLNMTSDSVWVTACQVNGLGTNVQVGTKKLVGSEFGVTLAPSSGSVVYDPRGISTVFQQTSVRIQGAHYSDSVIINSVGKVVRQ
ncbi:MAG TPA: GspH/FimT family pseudopilin [Gemmatimonadales bacterium]|jgi:prepilin-type N-terminal cleavage/methylation domain-containing protein